MLVSINQEEQEDIEDFLERLSKRFSISKATMLSTSRPSSPSSISLFRRNRRPSVASYNVPHETQRPGDLKDPKQNLRSITSVGHGPIPSTVDTPAPTCVSSPSRINSQVKGSTKFPVTPSQPAVESIRQTTDSRIAHESDLRAHSDTFTKSREITSEKADTQPPFEESNLNSSQKLAGWYFYKGDLDKADQLYEVLINQLCAIPRHKGIVFRLRLNVAQIIWLRGGHKDSEQEFKRLNDSVEEHDDEALICKTAKWLALSQWKQGKYTEADRTIQDCFDKDPSKRQQNTALLSTRALILASAGSFNRALKDSMKAIAHGLEQNGQTTMQQTVCIINHARVLSECGRYEDAAKRNDEALSSVQKRLGPKHFVTLDAASLRVWLLVLNNNTSKAGEEVQRTLRQMRERLGEDHPTTLQTVQTLVVVYKNDGRYSDAEATARYLLRKCESSRELGRAHPQTLKSKTTLAEVMLALGDWEDAELYQREVVKEEKATYFHRLALANILRERGKWDEAREIAVDLLLEQLHHFSSDGEEDPRIEQDQPTELSGEEISKYELKQILHKSKYVRHKLRDMPRGLPDPLASPESVRVYPSLVQTMQCVALCEQVRDDANIVFSESLLEKIHDICVRRLSASHQFTIAIEHDLAVNHRLRGKFSEALDVIIRVIDQRRDILGNDHPDYLLSRHQRAVILLRSSKWQEALKEQEFVLKAQQFLLGARHPTTVLSRYTLAGIYHSLHRLEDADRLLSEVVEDQMRIFNPSGERIVDHTVVTRSRARLALVRLDRAVIDKNDAMFAGAKYEQEKVVRQRIENFGKNHHLTQSSQNDLAAIEQASGNREAAENIYKFLLAALDSRDKRNIDSKSHENILVYQVKSNLATCFYEMGRYEDAEKLQSELYSELKGRQETDDRYVASTFNLALTYKALRQYDKAYPLLQDTVKSSERRLGDRHPQTQELKATLAKWEQQYDELGFSYDKEGWAGANSNSFASNAEMTYPASEVLENVEER
jgi:tetratricopeptide (TPR) repeat protein